MKLKNIIKTILLIGFMSAVFSGCMPDLDWDHIFFPEYYSEVMDWNDGHPYLTFYSEWSGRDIFIGGDCLYVAGFGGMFDIYDISDGFHAETMGSLNDINADCLTVHGDTVYLNGNTNLYAVDVADPRNPVLLTNLTLSNLSASLIAANGNDLIIASRYSDNLMILDISSPIPEVLTNIDSFLSGGTLREFYIENDTAILTTALDIQFINVNDPLNPTVGAAFSGEYLDSAYYNGYVYALTDTEVEAFKIQNPSSISKLNLSLGGEFADYNTNNYTFDEIDTSGQYLIVRVQAYTQNPFQLPVWAYRPQLIIFDLAQPEAPVLKDVTGIVVSQGRMWMNGQFVYSLSSSMMTIEDINYHLK